MWKNSFCKAGDLKSGNTKSCGCLLKTKSYACIEIENFLEKNQIKYKREFTFNDLLSKKEHKLRFDYAIFDKNNQLKMLLEYNGPQHYKEVSLFWRKRILRKLQLHDYLKQQYCSKFNYPLHIFTYKQNISKILTEIEGLIKKYN